MLLRKCGSMHRCAAWSICERKRDFLWVFFMAHAILWRRVVWCGLRANAALPAELEKNRWVLQEYLGKKVIIV